MSLGVASTSVSACVKPRRSDYIPQGANAYIDFTTKQNGDPPSVLDSGQSVDFVQDAWTPPRMPRVASGALVHGDLPETGAFANYYQAQLDRDCRSFGTRWTVDIRDGMTPGVMCIAAWAGIYESGTGMAVPRTPGHIVVDTVTGAWQWWVSDGQGSGAEHLKVIKAGVCTPPASDGIDIWEIAVTLDPDHGVGRLLLPGSDKATGSRQITINDAEIETVLREINLPSATIASTLDGANVVMVEHFASRDPDSARYPRFLSMWANTNS